MRKAIEEHQSIKHLGVLIDSTLSWMFKSDKVASIFLDLTPSFTRFLLFVSQEILNMVYYSLIFPHLLLNRSF